MTQLSQLLDAAEHEQQLRAIVEEYARRLCAGEAPDPYELMMLHVPLARELEERLQVVELLYHGGQGSHSPVLSGGSHRRSTMLDARKEPHFALASPDIREFVGRYQIRELLGSGGSSVVYRAWDPKHEREVALKVLHARVQDRASIERFQREAPTLARLRHPHIVPLHESGEADGQRYLDSELIVGQTLEQRLEADPNLTAAQSAELVAKLAGALHYAHAQGVVHRDVKPSNILLDARGDPQLTDFGLARRVDSCDTLTAEGQLLGSPAYMSPEQAAGNSRTLDAQSDVYSLGVVFYQLLTGRLPFPPDGSLATLIYRVAHADPAPPRKLDPAIPKLLESICLKALEKSPADRFQSAGEFADELRRWLNDEPSLIRRPAPWEIARRWARRNRLLAWTLAIATLVVVSLLGAVVWKHEQSQRSARAEAHIQILALHDAVRQRLREPAESRRSEAVKLLKQTADPRRRVPSGSDADRLDLTTRSLFAWTLATTELQTVESIDLPGQWDRCWPVALHPDGELVAIGTNLGPVVWQRGQKLVLSPDRCDPKPGSRLTYIPDGQFLLVAPDAGGVEVWDPRASRLLGTLRTNERSTTLAFGFTVCGTQVIACQADGAVFSLPLPDFSTRVDWPVDHGDGQWTAAAFDRTARRVARGNDRGRVEVWDADGRMLASFQADTTAIQALAWSPNDPLVAVGPKSGAVRLWNIHSQQLSMELYVGPTGVGTILFTPDGQLLLAGQRGAPTKVWDLTNGQELAAGPGTPSATMSRDGRLLAAGAKDQIDVCELSRPAIIRQLSGHARSVEQLVWSANGERLASIDTAFQIHVWGHEADSPLLSLTATAEETYAHHSNAALAMSPDGRLLAFASGGRERSNLFMRDTQTGELLWEGTLEGGYEHLAAIGHDAFLLVREEGTPDRQTWRSAVYEWKAGQPPRGPRVLRQGPAGEVGFFDAELTRNGKYYAWSGPRNAPLAQRVEIIEIETGRTQVVPRPTSDSSAETNFCLSEDGKDLFVATGADRHRVNLPSGIVTPLAGVCVACSQESKWLMLNDKDKHHLLLGEPASKPWLEFATRGDDPLTFLQAASFSPDGRYLAWGTPSGHVRVVELAAVQARMAEFQRRLDAK